MAPPKTIKPTPDSAEFIRLCERAKLDSVEAITNALACSPRSAAAYGRGEYPIPTIVMRFLRALVIYKIKKIEKLDTRL